MYYLFLTNLKCAHLYLAEKIHRYRRHILSLIVFQILNCSIIPIVNKSKANKPTITLLYHVQI